MKFVVKKASDIRFLDVVEISSIEDVFKLHNSVVLVNENKYKDYTVEYVKHILDVTDTKAKEIIDSQGFIVIYDDYLE